jgi:hypothetical protein
MLLALNHGNRSRRPDSRWRERHWRSGRPVEFQTILHSSSPKFGNISNESRRMWALFAAIFEKREYGELPSRSKSAEIAGFPRLCAWEPGHVGLLGWGGRIRTSVWRNQNPLPYHLATPQCAIGWPPAAAQGARPRAAHHSDATAFDQRAPRGRGKVVSRLPPSLFKTGAAPRPTAKVCALSSRKGRRSIIMSGICPIIE